jgi:hypothetical protein
MLRLHGSQAALSPYCIAGAAAVSCAPVYYLVQFHMSCLIAGARVGESSVDCLLTAELLSAAPARLPSTPSQDVVHDVSFDGFLMLQKAGHRPLLAKRQPVGRHMPQKARMPRLATALLTLKLRIPMDRVPADGRQPMELLHQMAAASHNGSKQVQTGHHNGPQGQVVLSSSKTILHLHRKHRRCAGDLGGRHCSGLQR